LLPNAVATFTTLNGTNGLAHPTASGDPAITSACLLIQPANTTCQTTVSGVQTITIANEGTYRLTVASGVVTYTALSTATPGTKTPVTYRATDAVGNTVTSTLTPIIPSTPVLTPDSDTTGWDATKSVNVLANDSADSANGLTLAPSTLKLCVSTATTCTTTSLVVANQGTYTANSDGTVSFDPLPTFSGVATPIRYFVADNLGQVKYSTLTMTVAAPNNPVASPDTENVIPGGTATFPALKGATGLAQPQTVGDPAISSVCLVGTVSTGTTCDADGIITVAGEGTYTLNATTGVVTFVALAGITPGTKTPMYFMATDTAGHTVKSTLTPIVPVAPTLVADTSSVGWDVTSTVTVLANDTVAAGGTLDPSKVKLCITGNTPPACTGTTLTVANQGTYTVNANGTITFDPLPTFSGTATPVTYSDTDSFGQTRSTTLTMTVANPANPVASPSTKTVLAGSSETFPGITGPTGLAQPSTTGNPAITSACLLIQPANTTCQTTVVSGASQTQTITTTAGTYVLNVLTGEVVYTANANASVGNQPAVTYKVTDAAGHTATSTLTPVVPSPPTSVADTNTGNWDIIQNINVLGNDTASGSATLNPTSVKLCASGDVAPNCTLTTLTVANQGTYTVNADGTISFDPLPTFTGTATPVRYSVTDSLGLKSSATLTPTVLVPAGASVTPNTKSVLANTTGPVNSVNFDPILGAGGLATPGASPITSICLVDPATTNCATTTNGTQTVTTAQGTFVLDVTTGVTNFTPANGVTGALNPITYKVTDASGQVSSSTLTPIIPPLPTARPDYSQGEIDQPQILSPLGNDSPGASSAPILASSLCLIDPATSICAVTDSVTHKQTVVTANGTYVLDVPTGNVTFTPAAGFLGVAAPAAYQITDSLGQKVTGTLNPKTLPTPAVSAVPDAPAGVNWSPTVTVVIDPLANDSAGHIPAGYSTTGIVALDPTSVKFCGPTQAVPTCTLTSVTVANEGTYTINPSTGAITFDPVVTFTGTVTVSPTYMVCNTVTGSWTDPQSNSIPTPAATCATASVTPTINPVAPLVGVTDTSTAEAGVTQVKNVATNDTGVSGNATVKICGTNETSPNCTQTQVTVDGVGTYVVSGTTITFIPLANYTGTPAAMPYVITDELARTAASTYTPTVTPTAPPVASPESKKVLPGVTASFTTITGSGGLAVAGARPLTPSLTCLVDGTNACVQSLTTASGTWSVDPTTSLVSFTATQGTAPGTLPSVTYKVFDSVGNTATSSLTPIIPERPISANDTSTGLVNANQTISILANDTSRSATPIVATSIKLCDIGQTGSACTATSVTVVGEGTYSVNSSGVVTFAPTNNYIGTATPISYVATDTMGQTSSAAIALTVTAPAPVAVNNSNSGMQNVTQTFNITNNDTAASGFAIDPATARLCESLTSCTSITLTTADGTFTLAANGTLSFVPTTNFVGTVAPISYKVNDTLGQSTAATVSVTVTPAPAPTAVNDTSTGLANTVQTINVLTGDSATVGYPIVTNAVKLCAANVADSLCADLQVTVPEGTYAVNGSGVVTFTPNQNYFGTPTPIKYLVTDTYGSQDSATIQPVVTPPGLPVLLDNTSVDFKNQVQTFNITNNDTAATNFSIDVATARLCETVNSCTSTTLTVAGQGTYVLSPNGDVVFTPVNNYVGTATQVKYQVRDSVGQASTAFIRVTVTPTPTPVPTNDSSTGPINTPQVKSVLTNDTATPGYPIVSSSVLLCASGETAPNCTATSVVIAGQGAYSVDSAGVVTFTPELNYFGTPTPVRYVVADTYGSKASALYSPVVVPPAAPVAVDNTSVGLINAAQTVNILANDTVSAGLNLDPSTAGLCLGGQTGVACVSTSVTIAGQGTYVLASNGDVVFTPVQDYVGTATPVRYVVKDNLGQLATALIRVEVTPIPVPVALNDNSTGYVNATQTIRVLANDTATQGYPIDITSVKLCGTGEVAPSCNQTTVTIAGEGTYAVDAAGVVTFTPEANYVGTPTPVGYVITDSFGSKASALIRPVVIAIPIIAPSAPAPAPVTPEPVKPEPVKPEPVKPTPKPIAKPDQKSSKVNTPVTIKPIANDIKATVPLMPTTLALCVTNCAVLAAAGPAAPVAKPIPAKEGTWSVESTTGNVTFTPVKSWFGRASIKYVVFDQAGNPVISTITVVIPKPKLPKTLVYTGDNFKAAPKSAAPKSAVAKPKAFATITAPRLGKNWSQKIFQGTSVAEVLTPLGLGHYEMTAMPGEIGNFAVAGHRFGSGGPFLNIDKFRAGDLVYVTSTAGKTFTYRYLQTKVVRPSEVDVVSPDPVGLTVKRSSNSLLTLQTCTPVHVNTHRLIVWFELVD
jgi:LPXTG-site transpeptidase (sortase) family protein